MTSIESRLRAMITLNLPVDLQPGAELSLRVPQFGPHHCEGPFMATHLDLIIQALGAVVIGEFDSRVPLPVRALMARVAQFNTGLLALYTFLHDLDKANCLTLVYTDGTKQAVSWDEWEHLLMTSDDGHLALAGDGNALTRFCRDLNLKQISYYQEVDGSTRTHGKVTAERLRGRADIPEIVVKAVETHEIAFQFGNRGGINIPLFEKNFATWTADEIGFMLLVNYGDQMGSFGADGTPDIGDFVLLAETYMAFENFKPLKAKLEGTPGLDKSKLAKAIAAFRDSGTAFQGENYDTVYNRIVDETRLPRYEAEKLRVALTELSGRYPVLAELLESVIDALVSEGQIPPELGRQLGPANKDIRMAIAGCLK